MVAVGILIGLVWYGQDIRKQSSVFPVMGVYIMLTTIGACAQTQCDPSSIA